MTRRCDRVLLALTLIGLGVVSTSLGNAQMLPPGGGPRITPDGRPAPPPGRGPHPPPPPPAGGSGNTTMNTIPRVTAFFIAGVEVAVVATGIVMGVVRSMPPPNVPTPQPASQPVAPPDADDRKRPVL